MATSVLVVDDYPRFRVCARQLLEGDGYRVVGEAENVATALECARKLRPELVLVDVHLPDGDGFDLAARLAELDGPPAVVLISSHDRAELDPLVPASAARGFVPKDELSREAIEALIS